LDDIPKEAQDVLNDPALKRSVEEMPGSDRFKAMVLGLSAFSALRADYDPPEHGQVNPMFTHEEP
jgi:hypothetical protein